MDINYFRKIQNAYNSDIKKNPTLYSLKREFNERFDKSPDYEQFTLFDGVLKESIVIATNKDNEKKIKVRPDDTFQLGQVVDCFNEKWLITSIDPKTDFCTSGLMMGCNYTLKFQNQTYDIVSYPCVILNASQYNSGIDENKTLTIGSNQFMIYLPLNEETSQLTYDRRLFISNNTTNPVPYKVTRPDDVSKTNNGVGVLCLIMSQDQLNLNLETDRPDLGICNYVEKPIIPVNSIPITYTGNAELKIGNSYYKTFTADTTDTVIWTVTSLITNLITEISGNVIKIKCPFDYSYIGMTVTLKAETVDNSGEITLKVVGVI